MQNITWRQIVETKFGVEETCFLSRLHCIIFCEITGIFLGTGAGFHHPEYALHQFGSFSTIQCHLPITGASTLSQGHETALSLWSPSPSKKNPSITTPGQRLSPTALPSDITS